MRSRKKSSFSAILCVCLVLMGGLPGSVAPAGEVAVIKVQYSRAAELVPVVESMLSAEGNVTVSQRTNSLVVEIGVAAEQQDEVIREILSRNQGGENTLTVMSLMVERSRD